MQVTIVGMIIGVASAFISLKGGIVFTFIAAIGIESPIFWIVSMVNLRG